MLLRELRESGDMAEGRAEVMRYGISKCLQFLINGLELSGSFFKLFVEGANFLLPALALGDVVVRFQDRSGPPLLVSPQRPSAGYYHLGSVSPGLRAFAVPSAGAQQLCANLLNPRRKDRLQKVVRALADRFLCRPAEQLLGSPIPVSDDVTHITGENGVVGEIQQAGLLSSFRHFDFEVIASLTKLSPTAAPTAPDPR